MIGKIVISALFAAAVTVAANAQVRVGEQTAAQTPPTGQTLVTGQAVQPGQAGVVRPVYQTRRQRYDRGLAFDTKTPSMPRGLWILGTNVSYSQHSNDDYGILILNNLNSRGNAMSVSPMVHYVFANNQSIGVRFAYKRNWLDLQNVDLNITQELQDMLFGDGGIRYQYQNHTYMGYFSYRYYVGIGASKRLLMFNEVQAGFGGGQQREDSGTTESGDYKRSTHQTSLNFRLGFAPGAAVFVTNVLAVEVQIGLLGYEWKKLSQQKWTASTTPGEVSLPQSSSRTTSSISTKFDFLSIAFGMAFYL